MGSGQGVLLELVSQEDLATRCHHHQDVSHLHSHGESAVKVRLRGYVSPGAPWQGGPGLFRLYPSRQADVSDATVKFSPVKQEGKGPWEGRGALRAQRRAQDGCRTPGHVCTLGLGQMRRGEEKAWAQMAVRTLGTHFAQVTLP